MLAMALMLAAADPTAAADRATVDQAAKLVAARHPDEAVALLDPVIAAGERALPGAGLQPYCTRTDAETRAYIDEAARQKLKAAVTDTVWCDALLLKGFAQIDLGQDDAGEALLKRVIRLAPMNARYLDELGELYRTGGDLGNARQYFVRAEAAAQVSPDNLRRAELVRALRGQALILTTQRQYDAAEALHRKVLALDPNDPYAKFELDRIATLRRQAAAAPGG